MRRSKPWYILIFLFAIINIAVIVFEDKLTENGVDTDVLLLGNLILFVATLLSYVVYKRSLKNKTSYGAINGMYGSFAVKFFICLIAVAVYLIAFQGKPNKPALFICMGLYMVYSIVEVATLQILLKRKKNA